MEEATPAESAKPDDPTRYVAIGALVAALPFYLFTATIVGFERRNPEDGMIIGFMMMAEIPLWMGLGVYLGAMASRAQLPKAIAIGMWLMAALAAFACFSALGVMGTDPDWLVVTPLLLPLVAVAFGLWARSSTGAASRSRHRVALGFATAAAALIVPVLIAHLQQQSEQAAYFRELEAERARKDAELDALLSSPDTRLDQLLPFIGDEEARHYRVMSAVPRLPSRQADAVRLLDAGRPFDDLMELWQFNLEPGGEFCYAYRRRIERTIGAIDPANAEVETTKTELARQSQNLEWLVQNGCDLSPQLRVAATRLRALPYSENSDLDEHMEEIARIGE